MDMGNSDCQTCTSGGWAVWPKSTRLSSLLLPSVRGTPFLATSRGQRVHVCPPRTKWGWNLQSKPVLNTDFRAQLGPLRNPVLDTVTVKYSFPQSFRLGISGESNPKLQGCRSRPSHQAREGEGTPWPPSLLIKKAHVMMLTACSWRVCVFVAQRRGLPRFAQSARAHPVDAPGGKRLFITTLRTLVPYLLFYREPT